MQSIIVKYHNVDTKKLDNLISTNKEVIKKIQNAIMNLPALNIVNNHELLEQTIIQTNKFAENKNQFIVFGTGGSNLGSRALINILQGKEKNKVLFYNNVDPISFQNSIEKFDLKKIGYIIISKSGTTPETLSQFACLIELFDQKKDLEIFFRNCLIITENKSSPLRKIGMKNKCKILNHEINIGGRFSVFSNVAFVPAIIAGIDVKKIHNGVKDILTRIKDETFKEHLKASKLLTSNILIHKINNSVLMTYSDALIYFARWYLQLWAESIGKNGMGITPIHAIGTIDQHSQLQLYLDGPKDKFFTFVTTKHSNLGLKIHKKELEENDISYLAGKSMGDLMQAEQQATMETFKKRGFAYREIYLPKIDEFSIGQLMTLSMLETVAACIFLGVNPFDQPAVEQGKSLTRKYLS